MTWTKKYKKSIDCNNPKGFSQKAHCQARDKRARGEETKSKSPFNEDFGIARSLSTILHRGSYNKAKKTLSDVMKRKQNSGKDKLYYAAQIAKSYPGVDARKLAAMHEETISETIRHEGGKWNIYSKDGSKRLGSYDTETAAKKRLGQIEYFKHMNEARIDKHEVSGKVVIDGHVFSDAGKSGRSTYGRYSVKDPNYVKDPKEVGMHRNYRKPSSLSFSTLGDAKKWVKTQPKKSPEEIDRIHKKHADFEKYMNEDAPVNVVGGGAIAGVGVGPQGEPGVNVKKKKKIIPFAIFSRKAT